MPAGKRILVADDDSPVRRLIADALRDAGYHVSEASDGLEVLRCLQAEPPDFLVLDLVMPEIDGAQVCRYLKAHPQLRELPVVLLSGAATEATAQVAELGVAAYLPKRAAAAMIPDLLRMLRALERGEPIGEGGIEPQPRRIVAELLAALARLQGILRNLGEGVLLLDTDGHILFANAAACALLRREEHFLLGAKLTTVWPETGEAIAHLLAEMRDRGGMLPRQMDLSCHSRPCALSLANITEDGRVIGHHLLVRDTTETVRIEELAALNEMASLFASSLQLDDVLRRVVERSQTLLRAEAASLLLADPQGGGLICQVASGEHGPALQARRLAPGQGVVGWVYREGVPANVPDASQDPRFYPDIDVKTGFRTRSSLCVPLIVQGRAIGVLEVLNSLTASGFTQAQETLLLAIAGHAAIAIENARLYEQAQRQVAECKRAEEALVQQTRQLEALRAVSEEITRELRLSTLLELIARRAADLVGGVCGAVLLWDEANGVLVPRAWFGLGEWLKDLRWRSGEGIPGAIAERRQGLIVNDFRTSPLPLPVIRERTAITAILGEPLLCWDRLVGVICIGDEGTRPPFTAVDQHILRLFALQAAIAVENAQLYASAVQQGNQMAVLNEAAQALTRLLDPGAVAGEILTTVRNLFPEAACRLWQRLEEEEEEEEEEETLCLVAGLGFRHPEGGSVHRLRRGTGLVGIAMSTRQPLVCRDVARDPETVNRAWAAEEGLVSGVLVPLIHTDRVTGVLAVFLREPHEFAPDEIQLLSLLAGHASVALENARLFERAQRRRKEVEAVRAVAVEITQELDLTKLLGLICRHAADLVGTVSGNVRLWDEGTQTLVPAAWYGVDEWIADRRFKLGEGVTGRVVERRQGLIVNDYRASPYADSVVLANTAVTAVLSEPLLYRDRLLGIITVDHQEAGRRFTERDQSLLRVFAHHAAVAIENARLFAQVRAGRERLEALSRRLVEVQEAERRAIARELHDEVGQLLTGLKLLLEPPERFRLREVKSRLGSARSLIADLTARVREMSLGLRPAMLDDLGLLPALLWHFDRYTEVNKVKVRFHHSGLEGRRFSPETETAAYRIVQEAMTNVARHAGTKEATVQVHAGQEALNLEVEDHGVGFDAQAVLSGGTSIGVAGMRERAFLLGGHLAVESVHGRGTIVTAQLPLGGPIERRGQERGA